MGRGSWQINIVKNFWSQLTRLMGFYAKVPLINKLFDFTMQRHDDLTILPINRSLAADASQMMLPLMLLEDFVKEASHRVIMNTCICRESVGCKDHPVDIGCLFLGEAAGKIHPKMSREVTVDEAIEHIHRALKHDLWFLAGHFKTDSLLWGVGPDEKLFTVCFCCDCCCYFNVFSKFPVELRHGLVPFPGVEVTVDNENCDACGLCTGSCFLNNITLGEYAEIGPECRKCGKCAVVCPNQAVIVKVTDPGYVNLVKERLRRKVDVT